MKIVKKLPHRVQQIEHAWIPLSDGCRLAARLWLPEDAGQTPVPAILEYIPYRKRDRTRERDEPMHHTSRDTATAPFVSTFAAAATPKAS